MRAINNVVIILLNHNVKIGQMTLVFILIHLKVSFPSSASVINVGLASSQGSQGRRKAHSRGEGKGRPLEKFSAPRKCSKAMDLMHFNTSGPQRIFRPWKLFSPFSTMYGMGLVCSHRKAFTP